jgi:hypothetical protein
VELLRANQDSRMKSFRKERSLPIKLLAGGDFLSGLIVKRAMITYPPDFPPRAGAEVERALAEAELSFTPDRDGAIFFVLEVFEVFVSELTEIVIRQQEQWTAERLRRPPGNPSRPGPEIVEADRSRRAFVGNVRPESPRPRPGVAEDRAGVGVTRGMKARADCWRRAGRSIMCRKCSTTAASNRPARI